VFSLVLGAHLYSAAAHALLRSRRAGQRPLSTDG
jgi:hypothetical protein